MNAVQIRRANDVNSTSFYFSSPEEAFAFAEAAATILNVAEVILWEESNGSIFYETFVQSK